jgi:hypothetical protein
MFRCFGLARRPQEQSIRQIVELSRAEAAEGQRIADLQAHFNALNRELQVRPRRCLSNRD